MSELATNANRIGRVRGFTWARGLWVAAGVLVPVGIGVATARLELNRESIRSTKLDVERSGGHVEIIHNGPSWLDGFLTDWPVVVFDEVGPFDVVSRLYMDGEFVTDEHLVAIARLGALEHVVEVRLSSTAVTDAGMASLLRNAPELRELSIHATPVSGAFLKKAPYRSNLEVLRLTSTAVRAVNLHELRACSSLRLLDLRGVRIDEDSAEVLVTLRQLDQLWLSRNTTSEAARHRIDEEMYCNGVYFE